MKIVLIYVGTRGDMEPFIALGEMLKENGHDVTCAFPEQFRKLALKQKEANLELLFRQRELIDEVQPDRVIYNGKAVYPVIWGLQNRGKTIFVSPVPYVHYVKGHSHVAFNNDFGGSVNKLTFSLAYSGMVTTVRLSNK